MGVKQVVLSAMEAKKSSIKSVLSALSNGNEEAKKSDKKGSKK